MFGLGVNTITTQELAEKLESGKQIIIDVREPYEYASGHIRGSISIPLGRLLDGLSKYDRDAETFVICHSGSRSASAVRKMKKAGFTNAISVRGGIAQWTGKLKK